MINRTTYSKDYLCRLFIFHPWSCSLNRADLSARCTHASNLSVIGRIIGFCLVYKAGNRNGNLISSAAFKSHQPPVRPSSASPTPGSRQEMAPGWFWRERQRRREESDICLQIKVVINDTLGYNGGKTHSCLNGFADIYILTGKPEMIINEGTKFYRHHSHYAPSFTLYMFSFIIFMNLNYDPNIRWHVFSYISFSLVLFSCMHRF